MTSLSDTAVAGQKPLLVRAAVVIGDIVSRPSGLIGFGLVVLHIFLAIASPFFVPYDYKEVSAQLMLQAPSAEHWFGTDHLGRDIFTRTLLGGREALMVTAIATPIAVTWGGFLGVLFGLLGGRFDDVLMRVVDAFLSLPWILVMLLAVVIFGSSSQVLIPTLGFFYGIPVIRIARAATHDVVARDFVVAARARGQRKMTIIGRELLPNVLDVLMVEGAMRWSWMLLAFSSLSFLGFGVSPPTPDWGLMISDSRGFMSFAPWAALAPVVGLSSLIIGINLTADALAKAMGIDRAQKAPL
ncbi:ABC transporter permease [Pelagibius sp. Alg239-R121]|uniref:ABC transporter permease n=1 Tax=Pelagibius sp. Alg239-R121 TaxID=2993448 RepID=UPI0024A705D2|nr:ABC transporter permease [Pelagibius sp. Alg239-R121]